MARESLEHINNFPGHRFESPLPQSYYQHFVRTPAPTLQSHITAPLHVYRVQQHQPGRSKGLGKTWNSPGHSPHQTWLGPSKGLPKTWQGASKDLKQTRHSRSAQKSHQSQSNGLHQPMQEPHEDRGLGKHQTCPRLNALHLAIGQDSAERTWRTQE